MIATTTPTPIENIARTAQRQTIDVRQTAPTTPSHIFTTMTPTNADDDGDDNNK
jgi:hypothetical protein